MTLQVDTVEPPSEERLVGADELFFSTTDRRGVIRAGNSIFVKIADYSVEELIGAPHSIIRHPDMPAAAFKAMWDRLHSGRPMAAYVQNLTKDGKYYWVFATITPLGDGFLSVRMAPMVSALMTPARQLYKDLRSAERAARANGMSRSEAAALGEQELERRIRGLGLDSYDHFMMEALPAEVAARAGMTTVRYARRPGHGPVAEILASAAALDGQLGTLVARLDSYRQLSEAVASSSKSVLVAGEQLEQAASAARQGSAAIADQVKVLDNVAQVMVGPAHDTVDTLRGVVTELDSLRNLVAGLRFRIALARLHNDMVAAFASEVIDGIAPSSSLAEVPLLCDALHEGVEHMSATMALVNAKLASVSEAVTRAGGQFNDFRRFIGKWRLMVLRHRVGGQLASYIEPIDQMLSDGHDQLYQLYTLAERLRAEVFPFEGPALDAQLARIRRAVVDL
ncbi:MAG: PAS domain-containing protein [Kineosporiaceae bacterium]|jgi:PAS domain S-box-containing protein